MGRSRRVKQEQMKWDFNKDFTIFDWSRNVTKTLQVDSDNLILRVVTNNSSVNYEKIDKKELKEMKETKKKQDKAFNSNVK